MLKDKIKVEIVRALKAGETERVEALRYLVALIDKKELQLPLGKMNEAEEIGVLQKELKDKQESREIFAKAGRNDLAEKAEREIKMVMEYLPEPLSEAELGRIIDEVVAEKGGDFGLVMREVLGKVGGRVGGGVVAGKVRARING